MKSNLFKVIAGLCTLAAAACTANYENINSKPYEPGDLNPDDYALGAAMSALAGCVISTDENTTQFTDCLLGGPMGGYFADANAGWANTMSNYNPTDDWSRVFLKPDKIIPVLYSNLDLVQTVSQQTENPVPLAIANIIKVAAMHRVADTYGPIPYSQIGVDGSIATPYDPLDKVYEKFFEELDSSIDILTANQNAALVQTADYVYGGDVKKWIKFANSLKLRLAIRIAYADRATAKLRAEEAVSHELGVITSNDENATWKYFGTLINPIYTAVNYNKVDTHDDGTICETGGDSHAAADIIVYMNGYDDPRREKYFSRCEFTGYDYVGLRRGIVIPSLSAVGHQFSGIKVSQSDPLLWMNAAEVAFLRAEGTAIFGFNMGGTAESFYNEGIRLSFEQWDVEGAAQYMEVTTAPGNYTDPTGSNSYGSALSSITVKWDESAPAEQKQERIIVQKWIANWMLGNEAWADYRRTGYPNLIPATTAGNKSNGVVDSSKGARRMPYPLDEYVSNTENVNTAVSQYLGGADNMATNVWWDCKN
ncbi:MAG: SusD/RagB family nutrient-binding outer membrane lipoprotein [Alistipes sp.]|nr:SusD/RagB family nutrient-binding outer membrane lipoprotein [Alistipes sp.]